MPEVRTRSRERELNELLRCNHTLNGGILVGLEGFIVEVQARAIEVRKRAAKWSTCTTLSGLPTGAATEVLNRITGAFAKLGIPDCEVEILINLAPADLFKGGAWLDLPIAIIMLQAAGILPDLPDHLEGDFVLMELGIHGEIRRVPGALSLAYIARAGQRLIVPSGNEKECALILAKPGHEGCSVHPVPMLEDVVAFFRGKKTLENALSQSIRFEDHIPEAIDFGMIRGQEHAKNAAVIAAAGGHNLLMVGPPGEGKSMLAKAIPGILPKLTNAEKVELTKIYSACGELKNDGVAVTRRPSRVIHHTATRIAVIGGGHGIPMPGEVTLAHLGILFLDELAEFKRDTLESLRQPIEDGYVHISRAAAKVKYPCRFALVAAMNPCPCGYYGSDDCRCKPADVARYLSKISGPILDRIDLQVELKALSTKERMAPATKGLSKRLREKVQKARDRQHRRFEGSTIHNNASISAGETFDYCKFTPTAMDRFTEIVDKNKISTRSANRLAKVALTVADLNGVDEIDNRHVDEAAQYVVGGLLRDMF